MTFVSNWNKLKRGTLQILNDENKEIIQLPQRIFYWNQIITLIQCHFF
jgi:hypothetical protein